MEVISIILFILTSIYMFIKSLYIKKSDTKLHLLKWACIHVFVYFIIESFFVIVLSLFHLSINLLTIAIMNALLGAWLWYTYKDKQAFYMDKIDLVILGIFVTICGFLFYKRFGLFTDINYLTSDPATHFQLAKDIMYTGKLDIIPLMSIVNFLIMSVFQSLIGEFDLYKIFLFSDFMMLFLSVTSFYFLTSSFIKQHKYKILPFVFSILYVLGYPLNNMLYGFVYLGAGVTMVSILLMIFNSHRYDQLSQKSYIIYMNIFLYGLFITYSMFAPPVFIALFLSIAWQYFFDKEGNLPSFIKYCFMIFLIPTILGAFHSGLLSSLFQSVVPTNSDIEGLSVLLAEGAVYRNLYQNFIFLIPCILIYIECFFTKKISRSDISFYLMIVFGIMMMVLFILMVNEKISTYYFYKFHYILWLFIFYCAYLGIIHMVDKYKVLLGLYAFLVIGVFFINFKDYEQHYHDENENYNPVLASDLLPDIYQWNMDKYSWKSMIPDEQIDLFRYSYEHILKENKADIVYCDYYLYADYWFINLSKQYEHRELRDADKDIQVDDIQGYIIIDKNGENFKNKKDLLDTNEIIYENEAGALYYISAN